MKMANILVLRDQLQIQLDRSTSSLIFTFPAPVIHDLELIDQIAFEKALQQFFKQQKISSIKFNLVLDESFLFYKKIASGTKDPDFFSMIPLPLDQQAQNQSPVDAKTTMLSVHNSSIVASLQRALHEQKNTVVSIVPFFNKSCKFDSEILIFKSSNKHVLTIFIFLILIFALGVGAWFYSHQPGPNRLIPNALVPTPSLTPNRLIPSPYTPRIDIKNGSGRAGEAGKLKTDLEKLKYTIISTGNADADLENTEIAAKITVPKDFLTTLGNVLKQQYVMSSGSAPIVPDSTSSADVIITIGTAR